MDNNIITQLPSNVSVYTDAKMRDFTTFQLGGTCPALIDCPDAEALSGTAALLVDHATDFIVIGQGSNLLVADEGLTSVVLRYCADESPEVEFDGCRVRVSGSTLLDDLVRLCIDQGVGDISYCSGIPGTVGGAIAGNAGAFGQQIGDVIESVRLMDLDGVIHTAGMDELDFQYRSSALKLSGSIVLDAELKVKRANADTMRIERERILELRRSKHPEWKTMPCAGSVFRNVEPTSAAERRQAAGWFLEEAGAKEFRVGGAHLFEKHANIIIAEKDASAADVFHLTEKMIKSVEERFGFTLVREIKLLGDF